MFTAEELFYKARSTLRSISTLLGVVILQRSSSTRQGAPVGVYLPCCVCKYCRGAHLYDTSRSISTVLCVLILQKSSSTRQEAPGGFTYPVVCVNTAEELFYKTRRPVGVYLPCCVCKYYRGALPQDKEHQ